MSDEIASLKAELKLVKEVLSDLIESKHGAEARGALQFIAYHREVSAVLALEPARNEDGDFVCCGSYRWHSLECAHMALWKLIEHPNYLIHLDGAFMAWCERQQDAETREEYERTRCTNRQGDTISGGGQRCTLRDGHDGACRMPMGMAGLNGMLRALYSSETIENLAYQNNSLLTMMREREPEFFGLDRSAPSQVMRVTNIDTENKIITVDQAPSLIVSPFVKQGEMLMFYGTDGVQRAMNPHDHAQAELLRDSALFGDGKVGVSWTDADSESPLASIKRAKEALEKMGKKP